MIDSFSPITRKFIAIAILFFVVMFCVNILILPAIGVISGELDRLADARFQKARLKEIQDRPLPATGNPIAADLYIHAASSEAAHSAFVAILNQLASGSSISLDQANAVPVDTATPQGLAVDLSVSGPELALTSFINDVEAHRPMVRFTSWKITAGEPGQGPARLSGRVIAAWSRAR